ncbi:hypothetical protein DXG01_011405 [Tephrocybe rancida]|nr:hypothetical protein DXG01_011405 [Tephrocybe rancida]
MRFQGDMSSEIGSDQEDGEWYIPWMTALDNVHDLILVWPRDRLNHSNCFAAALDAEIPRVHLHSPDVAAVYSFLAGACRRIFDLDADTEIYALKSDKPWNLRRLERSALRSDLQHAPKTRRTKDDYIREIDMKLDWLVEHIYELWEAHQYREDVEHLGLLHFAKVVLHLRRRRNSLTPISTLPPEILSRIFGFASLHADHYEDYPPPLAWIRLCHVCRHWWNVSRNIPSIWAIISPVLPQWTHEFLRRSKSSPLTVQFIEYHGVPRGIQYQSLTTALRSMDRIVSLSLVVDTIDDLSKVLDQMAPTLESFTLQSPPSGALVDGRWLFSRVSPRLARLSLHSTIFRLDSPIYRTLSTLELCNVDMKQRVSMRSFSRFLSNMSNLQRLILRSSLPLPSPPEKTFRLRSLQHLLIHDSVTGSEFLNHLIIGDDMAEALSIDLELVCRKENFNAQIQHHVLSSIARHIANAPTRPPRSARFSAPNESGMLVEGWAEVNGALTPLKKPMLSLWLKTGTLDSPQIYQITTNVCAFLPLDGVEVVSILALNPNTLRTVWSAKKLHLLPSVHTLHIESSHPAPILSALQISHHEVGYQCLAGLRILLFTDAFFDAYQVDLLDKVLVNRREAGLGLVHLQLDRCRGVSATTAASFKEIVSSVAWREWEDKDDDNEA